MTSATKILTVYTFCILLFEEVHFVNTSSFKLTNLQCMALNQTIGSFKLCSLKAVKRDIVELNVRFNLLQKPINNATFMLRVKKRGYRLLKSIYQYKVDICAFFRSDRRNPLADLFYKIFELKKYSNFNHSCPYDHDIIVSGCQLNTNVLNVLAISPGEYTIETNWIVYNKPVADASVSIKID